MRVGSRIRVVEVVEVVQHELHDLRVIVELVVGILGIALDVLQLDDAGIPFLLQVSARVCSTFELHRKAQECHHTEKRPLLNATLK